MKEQKANQLKTQIGLTIQPKKSERSQDIQVNNYFDNKRLMEKQ